MIQAEITKSGNFVIANQNGAVSKPYLNHCTLSYRQEKKESCESLGLQKHFQENYESLMFQGYDHGHDLGGKDPYAEMILKSNILK